MDHVTLKTAVLILFLLISPFKSNGEVLTQDTVWSSIVTLEEDVLVPKGISLIVKPGTEVNIISSDRTRTDPEYLSSLPEITVRGRLEVDGNDDAPVLFHIKGDAPSDRWGGIIVDGGTVNIRSATIEDAETGIFALKGLVNLKGSVIQKNRYGLVAQGEATKVSVEDTRITENDYGVFEIGNSKIAYSNASIQNNEKKDIFWYSDLEKSTEGIKNRRELSAYRRSDNSCRNSAAVLTPAFEEEKVETTKKYKDEVLLGDTVWRGRIEIDGLVRVPENARLIIVPGTVVEFRKKDTNNDNIGENGLLMQGVLIAKGTRERPIIFRSAEKHPGMGDWDAINILNSDGARNLVEFCRIEDAYRGLHFHFSNVLINGSVLKNNYRAIQFQESSVELRGNYIFNNKSGIKARDSKIDFAGNYVFDNINGINFFRTTLSARNNSILNNQNEGIKIREGTNIVVENLIDCNRFGLMVNDSYFGRFNNNVISNNFQTGVSLRESDNVELNGNFIQGNGFNGINILASGAAIKDNHISENGEKGIGIQSFNGIITGNTIVGNRLYALENESSADIQAPMNWWGGSGPGEVIFDRDDDPGRGQVIFSPAHAEPVHYEWPLETVLRDTSWQGAIAVRKPLRVINGAVLTIAPDTKVLFSGGAGMSITESKIIAVGNEEKRILFTSLTKDPQHLWGEILLEHASGSVFSYSDFEYASWALHSHFTDLKVMNSVFKNNDGGMRFRSGPVEISRSLFTENRIGMRAFMATALIKENEFKSNDTAIFVREKGDGLTIRNNNFSSNIDYSIRVGDFNLEDVDARDNWWGTDNPEETIFDGRREPGVGNVIFEPFFEEKLRQ